MNLPTKHSVKMRIEEILHTSEGEFLERYANGYGSRSWYLKFEGRPFPAKAVWAAAHEPPRDLKFNTLEAKHGLTDLGFSVVNLREITDVSKPKGQSRNAVKFSKFCEKLGFPLRNVRWSWCALNEARRQALFTVWENELDAARSTYTFWDEATDGNRTDHGAREIKRALDRSLSDGLSVIGVRCFPAHPLTVPRIRESFDQQSLLVLQIKKERSKIIGTIVGTIAAQTVQDGVDASGSAIDDLDYPDIGSNRPDRREYHGTFFLRDPRIRRKVIKRANGHCEHCGKRGFMKEDGTCYIEAHHIITLAQQGPDTLENVIGLCPEHHREAHFGKQRLALETAFMSRLKGLRI